MFSLVSFINCDLWHLCRWKRSCLMFELLWHLLIYVIPGGHCFWSLFAYLETVCILNLEMPDCLPMLSKCEWLEKSNIAFCSSRQYSSLSINQSMNCLETLTVTHTDASISVTIVLTFGKQKKSTLRKRNKKETLARPAFYLEPSVKLSASFKAVLLFCHVINVSNYLPWSNLN